MENKIKKKPLILLSNDDGYDAKGLLTLIEVLRPLANLVVMAPDGPRSGFAGALTITQPLRYQLISEAENFSFYKCSGTPVDCVKLALHDVLTEIPDLVIGGINHGDNSSVNVHYSGTLGIVLEGCMKGIPSIGFSLCDHNSQADFSPITSTIVDIVTQILEQGLPIGVCLNVNFPKIQQLRGVKICRQTKGTWVNEYIKATHPTGKPYFWTVGEFHNEEPEAEDTDHWALEHGYAAITPVQIDVTAYSAMKELQILVR